MKQRVCGSCGGDKRLVAHGLCAGCYQREKPAVPCSLCGRAGRVAERRDGQPVCHRCRQRTPRPCHVCGRTLRATKTTPDGVVCYTCYRKTLPRESCWVCGKTALAAAHTDEGAWCDRCRRNHLAEPCAWCGRTRRITLRLDDGGAVCSACYQRDHPRPLRQCIDCGRARPVARNSGDGPLCERCDDRRAPIVLCPRCGKHRKLGIAATGICRACAQQTRPREACHHCGRTQPVAYRDALGLPWCDSCRRHDRAEPCTGCGIRRPVCTRTDDGPWCKPCWEAMRPQPVCADCGLRPSMPTRAEDNIPRCIPCHGTTKVPCARCGTPARAERRWPEGPVCLPCVDTVRFTHQNCHRCGQLAAVFRREPGGPVCPECAGITFAYRCPTCRAMGRLLHGQCPPCRARQELAETFTGTDGRPCRRLAPLAEVLENYDNPYSLVLYLRRPGGQLIRAMARGDLECTRQALDGLRQTSSVHHLRGLLVLADILEPRNEELAQLKRDIQTCLDRVNHPHDTSILARYARWHLMPLAHRHTDRDGLTRYQREHLRRKLDTARLLLGYLRSRDRRLDTVTQHLMDRWLIANRPRQQYARPFLLWAATCGLAPADVAIATSARHGDRPIMSDTDRVLTALQLEADDSLPLADRVAGCLVLQYGQRADRIVRLTTEHILAHPEEPGILGLRLGRDPLWLCPRLSTLLQQLITERRPLAAPLKTRDTPFLFPGLRPDRPLTSQALQQRLQRLGIPGVSKARNGAWLALVGAVHWKMLADLLGAADGTAHAWHKWNGGDRASYVASRLRTTNTVNSPE